MVTVTTPAGLGSGVILDADGVLVTNLHVIRGQVAASVKISNGDIYDDVSVVDFDERKDLVLLKIKAFGLVPAVVGNSDAVQVGDRVFLIGSPQGLERSVSDGLISAIRDSGDGYRLFQTSAAASPGSSGGGMFNQYGELVGVVSSKLSSGENLNFGIPANYVRGLADRQSRMTLAEFANRSGPAARNESTPATTVGGTSVAGDPLAANKLGAIVRDSGLELTKAGDAEWSVSYQGDHLPTVMVFVAALGDLVVTQSVIAPEAHLTPPQLNDLLRLNFDRDLVKVALQDGKRLVALNETELRLLDGPALKRIVLGVALCADDVAGSLGSSGSAREAGADLSAPAATVGIGPLVLLQGHAQISFDPSQWAPEKTEESGMFQYRNIKNELWMKVIAERIQIPLEKMTEVAITNAQSVIPDVKVTRRGYRNVNGVRMLFLEFEGTRTGIAFTFYGHYYSDPSGTIQILGWTGQNLINEYRGIVENVVAGFSVNRK